MSGSRKRIKELTRLARSLGWTVEQTGADHIRWRAPDGTLVFSSQTPSKGTRPMERDLRKAGLPI